MSSRYLLARHHKYRRDNAAGGDLTLPLATTWIELAAVTNGPGTGGYDLVLAAGVGDVIEYTPGFLWNNASPNAYMDVATIVSAAVVNTFSGQAVTGTTTGVPHWNGPASAYVHCSGGAWLTVQAGDLVNGLITLRPYVRVDSTGAAKAVYRSAANPVFLAAKNIGPQDPH